MADPTPIILTPEQATNEGCPLLTKTRVIITQRGLCATVQWEFRDKDGQPMDLSDWLCTDADGDSVADDLDSSPSPLCGQVIARFGDAVAPGVVYQAIGWSPDPAAGIVKFELPESMVNLTGVYSLQIAITQQYDTDMYKIMAIDKGLLSIEPGLFGSLDSAEDFTGPPTLSEIRIALRDTGMENSLLNDVEFDDTEIIAAIQRPIRQWNETPPPVASYDGRSFPYHEHWLKATMALLMKSAAYWYERNRLAASAGGVSIDDRNKMQTYMVMAQELYQEWQTFILETKVSINAARAMGTVSSPYTRWF